MSNVGGGAGKTYDDFPLFAVPEPLWARFCLFDGRESAAGGLSTLREAAKRGRGRWCKGCNLSAGPVGGAGP